MALTQITDVVVPPKYLQYQKEYTPEKLDLIGSSAISALPGELASQFAQGGSIIDMPFWQDTDRTEPNIMSDDDTVSAVPKKITATQETARKLFVHKSWQWANLAGVLATGNSNDPVKNCYDYFENYWRRMAQIYAIKALTGVLADNVANDSSDMLYSVYSDIATPLAANKISPAALTSARLTMGEMMNDLSTIVMHSKVYGDALNQENITFVQPSHLPFKIAMFAGMQVVVSDDCPLSTGYSNTPRYTSYLFGPGAMAFGVHFPQIPIESFRNPEKGNGGGVETIHTRRHMLMHPKGFRFTSSSVAARSPTWAELATSTNWDRKYQRKNIPIAFLYTN